MSSIDRTESSRARVLQVALFLIVFGAGLAIRLYDVTDLPLEFHPTRQLLSHLKARGMYYEDQPGVPDWQRRMAVQQWHTKARVEPEMFERLVALTYRATGVQIWVPRVFASLFWMIAAGFLFLFVQDQVSRPAALLATGYFLFLPYAVIASRSFQPDGIMVMLVLAFWWAFGRWTSREALPWAIAAGVTGGLAIYVKFVAAFFVIGGALGLGLSTFGRQLLRKRQVLVMAGLGLLPTALYLYDGVVARGFLKQQFAGRFIPALLLSPINYLLWADMAAYAAGALAIAAGLLGVIVLPKNKLRSLLIALWTAYIAYGLFFDYHVATHDYYHLPLIGIAAVSMAPFGDVVWKQLASRVNRAGRQWALVGIFLLVMGAGAWLARSTLAETDYRPQAAMWAEIGEKLGHGPNVVALTADYGSPLAYWGWQNAITWPGAGDAEYRRARGGAIDFDELFTNLTLGNSYFLVTDYEELARQPDLQHRLDAFAVFAQGDGYIIYDLERPKS